MNRKSLKLAVTWVALAAFSVENTGAAGIALVAGVPPAASGRFLPYPARLGLPAPALGVPRVLRETQPTNAPSRESRSGPSWGASARSCAQRAWSAVRAAALAARERLSSIALFAFDPEESFVKLQSLALRVGSRADQTIDFDMDLPADLQERPSASRLVALLEAARKKAEADRPRPATPVSAPAPSRSRDRILVFTPEPGAMPVAFGREDQERQEARQPEEEPAAPKPRLRPIAYLVNFAQPGESRGGFQLLQRVKDVARAAPGSFGQAAILTTASLALAYSKPIKDMSYVGYDSSQPEGRRTTYLYQYEDGTQMIVKMSPLVFDLDGDGVKTSGRTVEFDLDGDGSPDTVNDVSAGDGALVFDANGNGVSGENGLELLGDNSDLNGDGSSDRFGNGFEAFTTLVAKALTDGVLTRQALEDKRLDSGELASLEKAYGLKMKVGGLGRRAVSLKEAGVAGVSLSIRPVRRVENFDGRGNDVARRDGALFTRADGSAGTYEDVWFAVRPAEAPFVTVPPARLHPAASPRPPQLR